ncbi:MAG: hypothetical protein GYB49_13770 [Alphaproteobacteria bacterium]|nr:hypothetical protein [Hyphomonas sp.]MBR9808280.1 hypothetical protein [Alphaproteobacteria bacterium]
MDRQTLDMEGARRGEISAASLQMGDDTIAIQGIATMSVESVDFYPWDTPANRRTKSLYATLFVVCLFFGMMALAWWGLTPQRPSGMVALAVGGGLMLLALFLGIWSIQISMRLKKRQAYFRLVIGAADGRQIPLVDNNRDVLLRIRDVVRHKMDTGDRDMRGDFDLDLDLVNLRLPTQAERPAKAAEPVRAAEAVAERQQESEEEERDVLFERELDSEVIKTAS